MASGVKDRQAPFTRIAQKQRDFIENKYIPRGLTLKDPRSMRRDEMITFLKHIGNRQLSHGIKDAFKFKAVLSSRKKGDIGGAKYHDPEPNPAYTMATTDDPTEHPSNTSRPVPVPPEVTPAFIQPVSPILTPEPGPSSQTTIRPRPRPRPTGRAKEMSRPENTEEIIPEYNRINAGWNEQPTLTLNPDYRWEPEFELDPSLDPDLDSRPHMNEELFTINPPASFHSGPASSFKHPASIFPPAENTAPPINLYPASGPASTFLSPAPVTPNRQRTPRRKGKNADMLAIEEAAKLLNQGKKRRG